MNPILQQTQDALMQKVDPRLHRVVNKIVEQGQRVMYSAESRDMTVQQLKQAKSPDDIGAAAAKLGVLLLNQSKGTVPMEALLPSVMLLLLEALGFLEEAGAVEVTPELVAACTQATASGFLQALGVTPEKLQGMLGGAETEAAPATPAAIAPPEQDGGIISGAAPQGV